VLYLQSAEIEETYTNENLRSTEFRLGNLLINSTVLLAAIFSQNFDPDQLLKLIDDPFIPGKLD